MENVLHFRHECRNYNEVQKPEVTQAAHRHIYVIIM